MSSRRVALALGASLLLHLVALLVFALRPSPAAVESKSVRPVVVTIPVGLREPARVERPVAPPGVDVASGEVALPPPLPRPARPAEAAPLVAPPASAGAEGPAVAEPTSAPASAAVGGGGPGGGDGLQGEGPAGPPAAGVVGGEGRAVAVDPSVDVAVHARLQAAASSCVPAVARRLKVVGVSTVRFCLRGGGELEPPTLQATSGQGLLDDAALGCVVQKAWPFPAAASGRCFTVPVRFGARD